MTDDGVLEGDSVCAEDRAGGAADLQRLPYIVELAQAHLLRCELAGILAATKVKREQQPLFVLDHAVDELLLRELERRDRLAELRPFPGVGQGGGQCRSRCTQRAPGDTVSRLVQTAERTPKSLDLREHGIRGQAHRIQHQLGSHGCAQRQLVLDLRR